VRDDVACRFAISSIILPIPSSSLSSSYSSSTTAAAHAVIDVRLLGPGAKSWFQGSGGEGRAMAMSIVVMMMMMMIVVVETKEYNPLLGFGVCRF